MARPFQIALESSDLEGAVSESENSELTVSDVIEDDAASDEAAEIQEDINRDSDALEELTEEVGVLADQVEKNEEKLENPEEVVAADVVVSEESLRDSMVRVGYTDGLNDRISFASESTYESLKMNPARHLSISNEGVKDFIAKLISTVKTLIVRIINYSKKLFAKLMFKFGNYEKKFANLDIKKLNAETLKANLAKLEDKKDFISDCFDIHPAFMIGSHSGGVNNVYSVKTVSVVMTQFEKLTKTIIQQEMGAAKKEQKDIEKDTKNVNTGGFFSGLVSSATNAVKTLFGSFKSTSRLGNIQKDVAKYVDPDESSSWISADNVLVFTIIGKQAYAIRGDENAGTKLIDNVEIKKHDDATLEGRIPGFIEYFEETEKQLKNRKEVFSTYDKNQNEYLKALNDLEKNQKAKDASAAKGLKIAVNAMKAGASQLNLLAVKGYIDNIKRTAQLANKILQDLDDGESKSEKPGTQPEQENTDSTEQKQTE